MRSERTSRTAIGRPSAPLVQRLEWAGCPWDGCATARPPRCGAMGHNSRWSASPAQGEAPPTSALVCAHGCRDPDAPRRGSDFGRDRAERPRAQAGRHQALPRGKMDFHCLLSYARAPARERERARARASCLWVVVTHRPHPTRGGPEGDQEAQAAPGVRQGLRLFFVRERMRRDASCHS